MPTENRFSAKTLFLTAAITAVVSGLIGKSIDKFVNRPRPAIATLSIGFQAPTKSESVKIPDDISNLSKQAHWAVSLERFEPFAKTVEMERKNREWIEEANEFIAVMNDWKTKYVSNSSAVYPLQSTLSASAILSHPFIATDSGGAIITVLLRRGLIGKLTYSSSDLSDLSAIVGFEDQKSEGRWAIFVGYKAQLIPYKNIGPQAKSTIDLFAESLGRGVTQNILEVSDYAVALTRKDILDAQKISSAIQEAILPNTTIAATVAINNAGGLPITFSPYFGLKIDHPDYAGRTFFLVAMDSGDSNTKENPFALTASGFSINLGDSEGEGEQAQIAPFLPNTGSSGYITVPGGQTAKVQLVGIEALGPLAKPLVDLHATKLLKIRLLGLAGNDHIVWSDATPFSLSIDGGVKAMLEHASP